MMGEMKIMGLDQWLCRLCIGEQGVESIYTRVYVSRADFSYCQKIQRDPSLPYPCSFG